ncbi:MAG: UDP-N-acetylmuramoyl-L-alanyl-D-glutamate--2,6-diaminopimelate ligase [Candidatus Omnitrophica bacterium]|nr:UDP-N-acetylmuramoyl-L-alanyl-D-glutamate--2,6-diaminopimelate ligase [Candidatus Omnitrophota bacterium]
MKLSSLFKGILEYKAGAGIPDIEIKGISSDSKKTSCGYIFVAVKGACFDGHRFIKEAVDNGASVILAEKPRQAGYCHNVPVLPVKDSRSVLARLASVFYGRPSDKLKIIGITGTNGKTTVTYLIEALLRNAKKKTGVIGTINYRFNGKIIPSVNTTPGPLELQPMFKGMLDSKAEYLVMEVSSHALDQKRVEGIKFQSAIFTNLTGDHLDYHGSFSNYFHAKAKLFRALPGSSAAIINIDDPYANKLINMTKARVITYGIKNKANIMAGGIKSGPRYTEFILSWGKNKLQVKSPLIGRHNIYNILAAASFALEEGLRPALIKSALEKFVAAPGRLERIDSGRDFSCFVDYAHTHDALKNVIVALREISRNKIIVVFGCGGDRDKLKRPLMGKVATELADFSVITNDNPRSENPRKIISDIERGIRKDNFCVVLDRKKAIKKAISLAAKGDVILVAGKGHEVYQVLGDKKIHFDDREAVRECLR